MRTRTLLIGVISIVAVSACNTEAFGGQLQVVHSIDFADPEHGLRDLAWDGEYLLISIDCHVSGGIFAVDPSDGAIVRQLVPLGPNAPFGGLAWDGSYFWVTGTPLAVGPPADEIGDFVGKIDPNAMIQPHIDGSLAPYSPDARQRGAAWDGEHLWLSDVIHKKIMELDPADMTVISSFGSPGPKPGGLAFDGTSLWCADGAEQLIYQIDTSGDVVEAWSLPDGIDPDGLTFDGQYLWVADNTARQIFQLAIPEPSTLLLLTIGAAGILAVGRHAGQLTRTRSWQSNHHLR